MTTPPTGQEHGARTTWLRLDRPVLTSNLVAGAACLVLVAALGMWPLAAIMAPYVVVGSAVLAAGYGHRPLSARREALTWTAPWALGVALGLLISASGGGGVGGALLSLWFVALVTTLFYLPWQVLAMAVRQILSWWARASFTRR